MRLFSVEPAMCVNSYMAFVNMAVLPTPQYLISCRSVFGRLTFLLLLLS